MLKILILIRFFLCGIGRKQNATLVSRLPSPRRRLKNNFVIDKFRL